MKKYISSILASVLILGALLFGFVEQRFTLQLAEQQVAKQWAKDDSFAQISCFLQPNAGMTERMLTPLRFKLKEALKDAAIGLEDEAGRTMVDAYSSIGNLYLSSNRSSISARAVGVGGDFFLFHPMKLLSGSFFDGNDLNEDGIILDEEVAWKLFGSYEVVGMEVRLGDASYPIRGVVRREEGHFSKAAEENTPTVFVSYKLLQNGQEAEVPIETYELLIQSPVTGFGESALKEAMGIGEDTYEIVENSTRFSIRHRFELLKAFGERSMHKDGFTYPYWENRARAYEDVATVLLVIEGICIIYPVIFGIRLLIILFRRCRQLLAKAKGKKI